MADKLKGNGDRGVVDEAALSSASIDTSLNTAIEPGLDTVRAPDLGLFTKAIEASVDPRCTDSYGRSIVMVGIYANDGLPKQPSFHIDQLSGEEQRELQYHLREIFEPVYSSAINHVGENLSGKNIPSTSETLLRDPGVLVMTGDLAVRSSDDVEIVGRLKNTYALAA